jgi:hypothetical protein
LALSPTSVFEQYQILRVVLIEDEVVLLSTNSKRDMVMVVQVKCVPARRTKFLEKSSSRPKRKTGGTFNSALVYYGVERDGQAVESTAMNNRLRSVPHDDDLSSNSITSNKSL